MGNWRRRWLIRRQRALERMVAERTEKIRQDKQLIEEQAAQLRRGGIDIDPVTVGPHVLEKTVCDLCRGRALHGLVQPRPIRDPVDAYTRQRLQFVQDRRAQHVIVLTKHSHTRLQVQPPPRETRESPCIGRPIRLPDPGQIVYRVQRSRNPLVILRPRLIRT